MDILCLQIQLFPFLVLKKRVKTNGCTFSEISLVFHFCLPIQWWFIINGKVWLLYDQILSWKRRSLFERF